MKMEAVRNLLKRPLVVGIACFIIGLLIGLIVLGWGLWPVKWTDASPQELRKDLQADYLRMTIDAWKYNKDDAAAQMRWKDLGNKAQAALDNLKSQKLESDADIESFSKVVNPGAVTTTGKKGGGSSIWIILVLMCIVTLLIAGGIIVFVLFRGGKTSGIRTPAQLAEEAKQQAQATDYSTSETPPIAQFMASYKQGDDLFDDSFSIDSPSGEFLGECGVGISETIGVGDPKKVTAFEVWLFDKNDIQTVTKVLMSAHAFSDDTVKQRLAAKGEPVEAKTGEKVVLETQTLKLEARVVDMLYGEGALPPESFFDQAILELAIWQK
jgi:hypothetical protein